ncbi:TonB-dependent Receptor Plug Domain [Fodinibius salinus]|uniref:TonB-dependent Receptor Plug Domain n=1 Tax=Fodinibius salinus TaxID=860790 RepID=A0A5D3YN10_9BACT|nr:TonB-dependent receptor [Fodinibius salinus]TYP95575.1 TonB-dependent Receptor Plug Domain [Fodinibius salinus]
MCLSITSVLYAQQGTIRGTVTDAADGEPLVGVNILVKGTSNGASTDLDGKFDIKVPSGTYDLRLSYISYESMTVRDIDVAPGEVTVVDNIQLQTATEHMEEVVVSAESINISEAALLTKKKNSPNFLDGISSETITQTGASDAADALKKVTGVSIQGGKYVYVRGLGDRYTKTMLNSVEIPSLDPTKNSLQVDIFPTSLIQNMVINKTATAELPADFTGGIVNIETIDFPEKPIFNVSASTNYNPAMHFNNNFLTNSGSKTDFLGFDSGARALPELAKENQNDIPTPISGASDDQVYNFVNSFNSKLGPTKSTNAMDYTLGLSLGNQFDVGSENKLGYVFSGTYKHSSNHFNNYSFGEYQVPSDPGQTELVRANTQNGKVSEKNVLLGGLAGIAFKTARSKYKLTGMHLQNGERKATNFLINNSESAPGQSGYLGDSHNLEYGERSITNAMLNGTHYFKDGKWEIDWRLSPTLSEMKDPDVRNVTYTLSGQEPNPNYVFNAGAGGYPSRLWRSMDETNLVGRVNISKEYKLLGETATFKFGGSHVYKQRDYEILSYDMAFFGNQPNWTGDPSEILVDENIYGGGSNGVIYYQSGNIEPNPNAYSSNVQKSSFYISNEFSLSQNIKADVGVRAEKYVQRHTGRSVRFAQGDQNARNLDDAKVLDALDFFPSANVTYSLSKDMNFRFSYSKTIARPSFRELSFAQILDPISNRRFNGGLFQIGCDTNGQNCTWDGNLTETRIQNFDFRWEQFFSRNQMLSVSAFYKLFKDPIELVRLRNSPTTSEYQPRNVGNGQVFGAELEIRKSLEFISSAFENIGFNGNVTVVKSQIKMTEDEFQARKDYQRQGQNVDDQRQMAGQAPYIINAGLTYENPEIGFDTGLFYNVKGETLVLVGGGIFPDVYSDPFHSLRFNLNKSFGAASVSLNISNILSEKREEMYQGFRAEDQVYSRFNPGRNVSLGFKYSF